MSAHVMIVLVAVAAVATRPSLEPHNKEARMSLFAFAPN